MGRAASEGRPDPGVRSRPSAAGGNGASLYHRCLSWDDGAAWAEVRAIALSVARRRGGRVASEAEDIANAVVLKLLEDGALEKVKDPAAFRGYVAVIAAREVTDRLRAPSHVRRVHQRDDSEDSDAILTRNPDPAPDALQVAADREAWAIVYEELSRMSEASRKVLLTYVRHILLDPQGSYETLTRALKAKRGTISSQVTRCLDRLLENPRVRAALGLEGSDE